MDATLPQTEFTFDFDRLDAEAFEATVAYLNANPEPRMEDLALMGFPTFTAMLEDAVGDVDWVGERMEVDAVGQSGGEQSPRQNPRVNGSLGQLTTPTRMPKVVNCSWLGCEFQEQSDEHLTAHLDLHASNALKLWRHLARCSWSGCSSKATFKNVKSYQQHLTNIHTRPLVCDVSACLHKKPFRNVADLSRHKITIHSESQPYACPYDDCEAEIRTFARKDKLLKHIREVQHNNDAFCPFPHCSESQLSDPVAFQTREEIITHFSRNHEALRGNAYECRLGSCSSTDAKGQWVFSGLWPHLQECHGLTWSEACRSCNIMAKANQKFFILEHLEEAKRVGKYRYHNPDYLWHDCTKCAPQTAQGERYNITLDEEEGETNTQS